MSCHVTGQRQYQTENLTSLLILYVTSAEKQNVHGKFEICEVTVLKRDSSCRAINSFLHNSLNLAFKKRKLHDIFVLGKACNV